MKKLKNLFILFALNAVTFFNLQAGNGQYVQGNDSQTGAGGICNYQTGLCLNYWFPTGSPSQTVTFPGSYTYNVLPSIFTSFDTITTAFTYNKKDSLINKAVITLTADKYLTAGAIVVLQLGSASDSIRTIYVNQDATPVDTVTVTNHKKHALYVYDGSSFQPAYK